MSSRRSFRWILVSWKTTMSASRMSNMAWDGKLMKEWPKGMGTSKVRFPRHGSYENGFDSDLGTYIPSCGIYNKVNRVLRFRQERG